MTIVSEGIVIRKLEDAIHEIEVYCPICRTWKELERRQDKSYYYMSLLQTSCGHVSICLMNILKVRE